MNLKDNEIEMVCMHDSMPPDESIGTPVAPMSPGSLIVYT
jgi:hypothetical protein